MCHFVLAATLQSARLFSGGYLQRREFITLLSGAAAWPFAARAQKPAMPVIGFLHITSANPMAHLVAAFRQGLQETGAVEGQNVTIEFHWAEDHYDRLPALVTDLVQKKVALIVTGGGEKPALAAEAATTTIPIVFNIGNDPVKAGLVASIGRPGGNATGVNILTAELEESASGSCTISYRRPRSSPISSIRNIRRPRPSSETWKPRRRKLVGRSSC